MGLRKVIADSSSIILLQKVDLFEIFFNQYNLVITEEVFTELTNAGKKGSVYLQEMLRDSVQQTPTRSMVDSMGRGESSTIAMFMEGGGDFVLLDDKKGANFCKDQSIPFINSLLAARILYIAGAIDGEVFATTTKLLIEQGYYSQEIISRAEKIKKSELQRFFPYPV